MKTLGTDAQTTKNICFKPLLGVGKMACLLKALSALEKHFLI